METDGVFLESLIRIYPLASETGALASFCSQLVRSSSSDIKENFIEENVRRMLFWASDEYADLFEFLLGLSPAAALHDNFGLFQDYSSLLFRHIPIQNWKIVNLLLAWGADPHYVYKRSSYSPDAQSPLSLAMYSSWTFWAFRNALHSIGLDVKGFVRKELEEGRPLLDAGWQVDTLTALLDLEFEPDTSPRLTEEHALLCDSCDQHLFFRNLYEPPIMVQPYWQSFLESIKNGTYPQRICSDTQDGQPFNSQRNSAVLKDSIADTADDSAFSHDPALSEDQAADPDDETSTNGIDVSGIISDRQEVWCLECWNHFKETGRRFSPASETESSDEDDASEDDFSPYLIHT